MSAYCYIYTKCITSQTSLTCLSVYSEFQKINLFSTDLSTYYFKIVRLGFQYRGRHLTERLNLAKSLYFLYTNLKIKVICKPIGPLIFLCVSLYYFSDICVGVFLTKHRTTMHILPFDLLLSPIPYSILNTFTYPSDFMYRQFQTSTLMRSIASSGMPEGFSGCGVWLSGHNSISSHPAYIPPSSIRSF